MLKIENAFFGPVKNSNSVLWPFKNRKSVLQQSVAHQRAAAL